MHKKKLARTLFALLLSICMVTSYLPTAVYAAGEGASAAPEASDSIAEETTVDNNEEVTADDPSVEVIVDMSDKDTSDDEIPDEEVTAPEQKKLAAPKALAAAATDEDEEMGDVGEEEDLAPWQDEDIPENNDPISVKIVLEGLTQAGIKAGSLESYDDSEPYSYVTNGQTITLARGDGLWIKGVDGMYLSAAIGDDEAEARAEDYPVVSDEVGGPASIGIEGSESAVIVIKASAKLSSLEVTPKKITAKPTKEAENYLQKGMEGTGAATKISGTPRSHNSPATFRITKGFLKEHTKIRTVTATCYSGPKYAIALNGTSFTYYCKVVSVSSDGTATIKIWFHPVSNTKNVSYKDRYPNSIAVNSYHAKTQHHSATVTTTEKAPSIKLSIKKTSASEHYSHPENYSLAGAEYYVYTDSECTKRAKTYVNGKTGDYAVLVTKDDGTSNEVELKKADYWIKEVPKSGNLAKAPGFYVDTTVSSKSYTASGGKSVVATSKETPVTGYVSLKKTEAKTDVEFLKEAPNNYTLAGAVFNVYTDSACIKQASPLL